MQILPINGLSFEINNESIPPKYISRVKSQGRKPSSIEYEIGTKIYDEFEIGNCSFFSNEIKYKSILNRLFRLNKKNNTNKEFTVRKCSELGEFIDIPESGMFCGGDNRSGDVFGGSEREVIEGFKIYRTK